jgi:hypothetical protein
MKSKLATLVVLASAVALSSTSVSAHVHKHSYYRNSHNAMNMMEAPSYAPPAFSHAGYSYGPSRYSDEYSWPGGSNLSGTGPSTFGGSGDSGGAGGGGP